ncbi:MAG: hypothetical protein ABFD50_03965 [Smithella sp.]
MHQRRNVRQKILFATQTILDQQGLAALQKADEFRHTKWQTIAALLYKEINRGHIRPVHPDILELIIRKSLQEMLRAPPLPQEIHFDAISHLIDILLAGMINRTPSISKSATRSYQTISLHHPSK